MYTCSHCFREIVGDITVIGDGTVSADGELEIQNTEHYHAQCAPDTADQS